MTASIIFLAQAIGSYNIIDDVSMPSGTWKTCAFTNCVYLASDVYKELLNYRNSKPL